MRLVEIAPPRFPVRLEIAYASAVNFTGAPIYRRAGCYLHPDAAAALLRATELARALELGLKIFDAFRPSEAQWKMWRHTPDPEFLADPRRGSPHSRGVAVDLTLIDRKGDALEMGTGFDEFTPRSHHGDLSVPAEARRNRLTLCAIMSAAGWDFYRNEWWHYQLFDASRYPLLSDAVLEEPMM